jgi:hypothetical protein
VREVVEVVVVLDAVSQLDSSSVDQNPKFSCGDSSNDESVGTDCSERWNWEGEESRRRRDDAGGSLTGGRRVIVGDKLGDVSDGAE